MFILSFFIFGVYTITEYELFRKCFFNKCYKGFSHFIDNYYEDAVIKIVFTFTFFSLIILKWLYAFKIRKYDTKKRKEKITPTDYTLFMSNLENFLGNAESNEEAERLIRKKFNKFNIVKINFVYDTKNLRQLSSKLDDAQKKIERLKLKGKEDTAKFLKTARRVKDLKRYYTEMIQEEYSHVNSKHFSGCCFVTFNTVEDSERCLNTFASKYLNLAFWKKDIKMKRAAEPQDYFWNNFNSCKASSLKTILIKNSCILFTYFLALCIIFLTFSVTYLLKAAEKGLSTSGSVGLSIVINFIISRVISSMNFGLRILIKKIVTYQKWKTKTKEHKQKLFVVSIFYICNSTITLLAVGYFMDSNYPFGPSGLAITVLTVQAFNIFLKQFWYLIKIQYVYRKMRKLRIKKKEKKKELNKLMQYKANTHFEGLNYSLSSKYYTVFRTVGFCFFFMSFSPYILLLGACEMVVIFWVQKYILINRANKPDEISFNFNLQTIKTFDMMILVMLFGFLTNEKLINRNISRFTFTIILVGMVLWCITWFLFNCGYCFAKTVVTKGKDFLQIEKDFPLDYDRLNPATQKMAISSWRDMILPQQAEHNESSLMDDKEEEKYINESDDEIIKEEMETNENKHSDD